VLHKASLAEFEAQPHMPYIVRPWCTAWQVQSAAAATVKALSRVATVVGALHSVFVSTSLFCPPPSYPVRAAVLLLMMSCVLCSCCPAAVVSQ
jgi:hypothetical protein